MTNAHYFLPTFHLRGKRYRVRFRCVPEMRLYRKTEQFPEGVVYTFRIGALLIVAMVDTRL